MNISPAWIHDLVSHWCMANSSRNGLIEIWDLHISNKNESRRIMQG